MKSLVLLVVTDISDQLNAVAAEESRHELMMLFEQTVKSRDHARDIIEEIGD